MKGKLFLGALLATLAGCPRPPGEGGSGPGGGGAGGHAEAEKSYAALCASCHGANGEGTTAPVLRGYAKGRETLVKAIDERMPLGSPEKCDLACAESLATFILDRFKDASPPQCTEGPFLARRVRQLSRDEYRRTVADSFGAGQGGACAPRQFVFDPKGRALTSVHVAGSFNGWPATVAQGGWAMSLDQGVWRLSRELPPGRHLYKLVLNQSEWTPDPSVTERESDGFGGFNSVLSCPPSGGGFAFDPASRLPPENRPEGFAFDNEASVQSVTAVYAEELRQASKAIAAAALAQPESVVPCDRASASCAESFIKDFGLKAFRRPLTDAEVSRYRAQLNGAGDFVKGASRVIQTMLSAPSFLYRSEVGVQTSPGVYRLTGYEVASALSYLFWGSTPDKALLDAAGRGDLDRPEGIEREARRLLASERSRDAVGRFGLMWLGADGVLAADKRPEDYPGFTPELRAALAEETRAFFNHVVFDSTHRYDELLTARYSMMNATIAGHYGIGGVTGSQLRKVTYPDDRRSGVLAHASVLASTAHADQTSPIRRGLFVRRRLLCQELPPPPPNAGVVPTVDPNATTKDRFKQHTANASCAQCHQYIDGLGFGFEHFDAVGKWRDTENGKPIDARGDMNDVERLGAGTKAEFDSLPQLASVVASSAAAKACFVKQYARFAAGSRGAGEGSCWLERLEERFAQSGFDLRELMISVATSPEFVLRKE